LTAQTSRAGRSPRSPEKFVPSIPSVMRVYNKAVLEEYFADELRPARTQTRLCGKF
jgi:hypothetical protein